MKCQPHILLEEQLKRAAGLMTIKLVAFLLVIFFEIKHQLQFANIIMPEAPFKLTVCGYTHEACLLCIWVRVDMIRIEFCLITNRAGHWQKTGV